MKILLSLALVFVFCLAGFGQRKSCDLTLKDAPDIRGLKFGMTESEVLRFFGVERKETKQEMIQHKIEELVKRRDKEINPSAKQAINAEITKLFAQYERLKL